MLITFLLCILYEAIKSFRYFLAVWNNQKRQQRHAEASITNPQNSGGDNISEDSIHIAPLVQLSGYVLQEVFDRNRIIEISDLQNGCSPRTGLLKELSTDFR